MMALTRDRVVSIAAKLGLGVEELRKPCEDCLFPLLANFVHPWRLVFSSLLSDVDLDDVDEENQSEQEKRVAALRKWKARSGREASYDILLEAILISGRVDQAELLCQLLSLQPQAVKTSTESPDMPGLISTISPQSPVPPRPCPTPPISATSPATTMDRFSPLSSSLDEEIEQLDEEYTEIESLVLKTIKLRNIPHKTMLEWVQVLPMRLKSQFSELLQRNAKALCNASSVDELFIIVSPYWNSLHPTLLEHLVKKLADDNLKSRMKKYSDDLCKFRIHTRLGDFIEKWAGGVPPGFDEFTLELGEEWREKTVEDLEKFRIRLSRQQCIGGHMTYMKRVTPGSIFVEFALPQCCFPLTFDENIQEFLREEHVSAVYVEGQCILDLLPPESEEYVEELSDDDSIIEDEIVAHTTALSDSGTESSSGYSYDTDAEYDMRMQSVEEEISEEVIKEEFTCSLSDDNIFPTTSATSLRFCLRRNCSEDGLVSNIVTHKSTYFIVSPPLKRTGELEMQLEGNHDTNQLLSFEISLSRRRSSNYYQEKYRFSSCILARGAVLNYLRRPASIQKNHHMFLVHDRIGINITRSGALEIFINGKSQGIVDEAVYKLGQNVSYYAVMYLPPGFQLKLTAGAAQTEVLSLQEMCVDCVAECLHSPKDVESLPLPDNIKGRIVKVVFDPQFDFCCDPQDLGGDSRHRTNHFSIIHGFKDMVLQKGHVNYYFHHCQFPISKFLIHRLKIPIFHKRTFQL